MPTFEAIKKLDDFAERRGADAVARAMRMFRCSGIPGDAYHCVVHDYLMKKNPDTISLEVDGSAAEWASAYEHERFRFGDNLERFTDEFDNHEYPFLEAK